MTRDHGAGLEGVLKNKIFLSREMPGPFEKSKSNSGGH
jgi:hypothetical protein